MKSRMPLNIRIFMIIFFSVILTSIAMVGGSFSLFSKVIRERFNSKIHFIGNNISNISSVYFITENYEQLKDLALTLMRDQDVGGVKIIDSKGNIIAVQGYVNNNDYQEFNIISSSSKFLTLFNPEQSQKLLGKIYIYYSKKEIRRLLFNMFFYSIGIGLSITLIMVLIGYRLIYSTFLRELEELVTSIQNLNLKEMEIEIPELNLPEMRILANSFNDMVKALKKSQLELSKTYETLVKEKSMAELGKFSLVIAHEFKNPLGIIKSALDVISKEDVDVTTKAQMIVYVNEEISRLDNLIKEFLYLKKPQAPKFVEIDFDGFIENIVHKCNLAFNDVTIKISNKISKTIKTDPSILEKVLTNLIKNAVEAEAKNIDIEMLSTDGSIKLILSDDGHGIEKDILDKIFEPFYTTKKSGTGLGLVIVDKMIKSLNGYIKFESEVGVGTKAIIKFRV